MVKERKVNGEWSVCNPLFCLPKVLLRNLSQIEIIDEKDFVHIDVSTIDNKKTEKILRLSDDIELTFDVRRQFCDFETSYVQLHNNQLAYTREVEILMFMWCFSPVRHEYSFLEPPIGNDFLMDVGEDHGTVDSEQAEISDVGYHEVTNQDQETNDENDNVEDMFEEGEVEEEMYTENDNDEDMFEEGEVEEEMYTENDNDEYMFEEGEVEEEMYTENDNDEDMFEEGEVEEEMYTENDNDEDMFDEGEVEEEIYTENDNEEEDTNENEKQNEEDKDENMSEDSSFSICPDCGGNCGRESVVFGQASDEENSTQKIELGLRPENVNTPSNYASQTVPNAPRKKISFKKRGVRKSLHFNSFDENKENVPPESFLNGIASFYPMQPRIQWSKPSYPTTTPIVYLSDETDSELEHRNKPSYPSATPIPYPSEESETESVHRALTDAPKKKPRVFQRPQNVVQSRLFRGHMESDDEENSSPLKKVQKRSL